MRYLKMGLFLLVLFILIVLCFFCRTPYFHLKVSDDAGLGAPIHLSDTTAQFLMKEQPLSFKIEITNRPLFLKKKVFNSSFEEEKASYSKDSLLNYISISRCVEDKTKPDFLVNKLKNNDKTTNKNYAPCGVIHTKIPFMF